MIAINTTHTITCENAPVQEVYDELEVRFPSINPLARELRVARSEIEKLTRDRDEVQRRLEESWAIKEKLMAENANLEAANDVILAGGSRPALPEGMRIAEHEVYGRVVVSPYTASDRYYRIFALDDETPYRADCFYTKPSALTFLDSDPEPEPLPKPEDCKAGEVYLVEVDGEQCPATRFAKESRDAEPWFCIRNGYKWFDDSDVTLLARLTQDRDIK